MILTCPECATSYFVDESKVPAAGRSVKCANCGARWTATVADAVPEPPAPRGAVDESPAPEAAPESFAEPTPASEAEPPPVVPTVEARPGDALPKLFRAKADTERKVRQAAAMGIVWAVMAVVLLGLLGAAVVFRADVVRAWPKSAAAFKLIGLPVNALSLSIEGVKAEPVLRDGHAAFLVSGVIRNIGDKPVTAPPIRIKLLNGDDRSVAVKIAHWSHPQIPPGESRMFRVPMMDPPSTSKDVEVSFAPEVARSEPTAAKAAEGHGPPAKSLRGPASPEPPPAAAHAPEAHPAPAPAQPAHSEPPHAEPHG